MEDKTSIKIGQSPDFDIDLNVLILDANGVERTDKNGKYITIEFSKITNKWYVLQTDPNIPCSILIPKHVQY